MIAEIPLQRSLLPPCCRWPPWADELSNWAVEATALEASHGRQRRGWRGGPAAHRLSCVLDAIGWDRVIVGRFAPRPAPSQVRGGPEVEGHAPTLQAKNAPLASLTTANPLSASTILRFKKASEMSTVRSSTLRDSHLSSACS